SGSGQTRSPLLTNGGSDTIARRGAFRAGRYGSRAPAFAVCYQGRRDDHPSLARFGEMVEVRGQGMPEVKTTSPVLFKDCTANDLHARLAPLGVSPRLARRLQAAVLRPGPAAVPAALPEVPRRVLDAVRAATRVPRLTLLEKTVSPADGFAKYLFKGDGPE